MPSLQPYYRSDGKNNKDIPSSWMTTMKNTVTMMVPAPHQPTTFTNINTRRTKKRGPLIIFRLFVLLLLGVAAVTTGVLETAFSPSDLARRFLLLMSLEDANAYLLQGFSPAYIERISRIHYSEQFQTSHERVLKQGEQLPPPKNKKTRRRRLEVSSARDTPLPHRVLGVDPTLTAAASAAANIVVAGSQKKQRLRGPPSEGNPTTTDPEAVLTVDPSQMARTVTVSEQDTPAEKTGRSFDNNDPKPFDPTHPNWTPWNGRRGPMTPPPRPDEEEGSSSEKTGRSFDNNDPKPFDPTDPNWTPWDGRRGPMTPPPRPDEEETWGEQGRATDPVQVLTNDPSQDGKFFNGTWVGLDDDDGLVDDDGGGIVTMTSSGELTGLNTTDPIGEGIVVLHPPEGPVLLTTDAGPADNSGGETVQSDPMDQTYEISPIEDTIVIKRNTTHVVIDGEVLSIMKGDAAEHLIREVIKNGTHVIVDGEAMPWLRGDQNVTTSTGLEVLVDYKNGTVVVLDGDTIPWLRRNSTLFEGNKTEEMIVIDDGLVSHPPPPTDIVDTVTTSQQHPEDIVVAVPDPIVHPFDDNNTEIILLDNGEHATVVLDPTVSSTDVQLGTLPNGTTVVIDLSGERPVVVHEQAMDQDPPRPSENPSTEPSTAPSFSAPVATVQGSSSPSEAGSPSLEPSNFPSGEPLGTVVGGLPLQTIGQDVQYYGSSNPDGPKIYAFLAPRPDSNYDEMVNDWLVAWSDAGYRPAVLTVENSASKHPEFAQYSSAVDTILQTTPQWWRRKKAAPQLRDCYFRYLAMEVVGGGMMVDLDMLPTKKLEENITTTPEMFTMYCDFEARPDPKDDWLHQVETQNGLPCMVHASAAEWKRLGKLTPWVTEQWPEPRKWTDAHSLQYLEKFDEIKLAKEERVTSWLPCGYDICHFRYV